MPDTIPTLKETILYALAFAQTKGIQALPVMGVAHFINHDGPILQPQDMDVVCDTMRELVDEGMVSLAQTPDGPVFIRKPDAPTGRSAVLTSLAPPVS